MRVRSRVPLNRDVGCRTRCMRIAGAKGGRIAVVSGNKVVIVAMSQSQSQCRSVAVIIAMSQSRSKLQGRSRGQSCKVARNEKKEEWSIVQVASPHRKVRDEHQANTGLSEGEPRQINTVHDGMSDKYYRTQQHCYKVSYNESVAKVGKSDVNIATSAAVHILQPQRAERGRTQCTSGRPSLGNSLTDHGVQMR